MSSFTSVSPQGPAGDVLPSGPPPGDNDVESDRASLGSEDIQDQAGAGPGAHIGGNLLHSNRHLQPDGMSEFLLRHASDALSSLGQLVRLGPQSLPQDRLGQPSGLLPVAALQACQAIMFMRTTKGGLGVSYSHGSGFLINKLDTSYNSGGAGGGDGRQPSHLSGGSISRGTAPPAGPPGGSWGGGYGVPHGAGGGNGGSGDAVPIIRWSAPCFYSMDSLSVGLTVGLEHTHNVLLLWGHETLARVKEGRAVLGTDVHLMLGRRAEAEDSSGDPGVSGDPGGPHLVLGGLGGGGGGLVSGGSLVSGLSLGGLELPIALPAALRPHIRPMGQDHPNHQADDHHHNGTNAASHTAGGSVAHNLQYRPPHVPVEEVEGTLSEWEVQKEQQEVAAAAAAAQREEEQRVREVAGKVPVEEVEGTLSEWEVRKEQMEMAAEYQQRLQRQQKEEEEMQQQQIHPQPPPPMEPQQHMVGDATAAGHPIGTTISSYTIHDGALLDFSLLGGALHPDHRHNRKVYGEGVTTDDILYGRVAPPDAFGPLYSTLRMLTSKTRQQLAAL